MDSMKGMASGLHRFLNVQDLLIGVNGLTKQITIYKNRYESPDTYKPDSDDLVTELSRLFMSLILHCVPHELHSRPLFKESMKKDFEEMFTEFVNRHFPERTNSKLNLGGVKTYKDEDDNYEDKD